MTNRGIGPISCVAIKPLKYVALTRDIQQQDMRELISQVEKVEIQVARCRTTGPCLLKVWLQGEV